MIKILKAVLLTIGIIVMSIVIYVTCALIAMWNPAVFLVLIGIGTVAVLVLAFLTFYND